MMELEELEKNQKLVSDILSISTNYPYGSLDYKKEVILKYREAINKPLDSHWLNKQASNVINGIFNQIVNGAPKKEKNENQIGMDDFVNTEEYQRLIEDYEYKKLMDELVEGYESYPSLESIRANNPKMSDMDLMEKFINDGMENKWDSIPIELHSEIKRIIDNQVIKSPDNNRKSR